MLKQALVSAGYPAEDLAGYVSGDALDVSLRDRTISGTPFSVREYQRRVRVNQLNGRLHVVFGAVRGRQLRLLGRRRGRRGRRQRGQEYEARERNAQADYKPLQGFGFLRLLRCRRLVIVQ